MVSFDDLDSVKNEARVFLYLDIEEVDGLSPMVVMHPFFECGIWTLNDPSNVTGLRVINLLEDNDGLQEVRRIFEKDIDTAKDVDDVFWRLRKSYRLTFLKYIKPYLSLTTFSRLLGEGWTSSENPNDDVNVPVSLLIKWFRSADKECLMDSEDYEVYKNLPSSFTIYRGVAVGRVPKGLSWTQNYSTAEWFANRFNRSGKSGYIQKAIVNKGDVFAYFNSRNEDEIVADVSKLDIECISQ